MINNPRLLLARLRDGDFAHAGDKEAIEIVLNKISVLLIKAQHNSDNDLKSEIKALDVGCGLGGTADYIKTATAFELHGIDIDPWAIQHAKSKYKDIRFFECDVMNVKKEFRENQFDLIYLFNVFYAIPQQKDSLKQLAAIGKSGALLVIFDYTCDKQNLSFDVKDLSGKQMNPVNLQNLREWFTASHWNLIEIVNLTAEYQRWYEDFIKLMIMKRDELLRDFSEEVFLKVYDTFNILLDSLRKKKIQGSVIYAKLNKK